VICAGQCEPPYVLQVIFARGTTAATAAKILRTCADHDPVVIRVGAVRKRGVESQAYIYAHVFGDTARTAGLLRCLRSARVAGAGWPD
jgi:hypothetical protein